MRTPTRVDLVAEGQTLSARLPAIERTYPSRARPYELGKDGVKVDLTETERTQAAALVSRLASRGASSSSYGRALDGYVRAVAGSRGDGV